MELWQRITGWRGAANEHPRDPDLDAVHARQHDLINQVTAIGGRDQWNERHRETWRTDGRHAT